MLSWDELRFPLEDLLVAEMYRYLSLGCAGKDLFQSLGDNELTSAKMFRKLTHQILIHALVERYFWASAIPHLVVGPLETLPVLSELLQAVFVYVLQSARLTVSIREGIGSVRCDAMYLTRSLHIV